MPPPTAVRICSELASRLEPDVRIPLIYHSGFTRAVNFSSPFGLVTVLAPGRALQPRSVLTGDECKNMTSFFPFSEPSVYTLGSEGIERNGQCILSLIGTDVTDLHLRVRFVPGREAVCVLRNFLRTAPDESFASLSREISEGDPYREFIKPRLISFRDSIKKGDYKSAVSGAARMAGCGIGLTPSSDDLLSGYIAALTVAGYPDELLSEMASAAAKKTNDISASLLLSAGTGLFSEDVIRLMHCFSLNDLGSTLCGLLDRVAHFGSTSGYDFLTGLCLGFDDTANRK